MTTSRICEQSLLAPTAGRKTRDTANFNWWKAACAAFLFCAATAMPSPAQTFTNLVSFDGTNGANPMFMSPIQGSNGNIYGTTSFGGYAPLCVAGCGTVFKLNAGGTLSVVYNFYSQVTDGISPEGGLFLASDSDFYGTTIFGGTSNAGVAYKIAPDGQMTTLYSFCTQPNCADGSESYSGLTQAMNGNFYGTASGYGYGVAGTVFEITSAGVLTTLYTFTGPDRPTSRLLLGTNGSLYGTTTVGGNGGGTIFELTPAGNLTTLHELAVRQGSSPWAGLTQGSDGNFYGTTTFGGANNNGAVFKITPRGNLTTLYSFCAETSCADGANPYSVLVEASDGNFYGTTSDGGNSACANGCGTVFEITPAGTLTTLYSFDGTEGTHPYGGLLQSTRGVFYGTTLTGGNSTCTAPYSPGCGTVFSLDMGLPPFVTFVRGQGRVGQAMDILGQNLLGTTSVSINGLSATFTVISNSYLTATVPAGAITGYVAIVTPTGTLSSNTPFRVLP